MPYSAAPDSVADPSRSLHERILAFFPPELRGAQLVRELADKLAAYAHANVLESRLDALVDLIHWTRGMGVRADGQPDISRLQLLHQVMDALPEVRTRVQDTLAEILSETEGLNLFGETGIPGDRGFFAEFTDRVLDHLLPQPSDEHDLARLLVRLFPSDAAARRIESLPPEVFHRLIEASAPLERPDTWAPLQAAFADGFRLLAVRVQAQGLSANLRARSHPCPVGQSPFHRLAQASQRLMDCWREGEAVAAPAQEWRDLGAACRAEMLEINRRLETEGVSVAIVYGLEVIERCLQRMERMVDIIMAPHGAPRSAAIQELLTELVHAAHRDRSVRDLLRSNMQMLERKIVDRSGKTGEHYVATTPKEYRMIWVAAAGGGLLTVLTAAIKLTVGHSALPLFVIGLLSGLNYAVSFMLLHHLHLVLATKQPAMTAATLATLMRNRDRKTRLDSVVEFMLSISSSQVAAAIANVIVVFVGAFAFNAIWFLVLGRNYLAPTDAQHVFETLSPVNSGTVFYAALTGVILWAAAIIGGWFDNWSAYRRLPQGIADHPLGKRIGRERMVRAAGVVSRNMAGWGTNISLGFLLGMAPVIGLFFGLPIDVRHVTLSSGMLAFAGAGLDDWFTRSWFFLALAGVGTMFVLNLSVSFLLSLFMASRAYDIGPREMGVLGARLLRRFIQRPADFVVPRWKEKEEKRDG